MTVNQRQRVVICGLLLGSVAYFSFLSMPEILRTRFIGIVGTYAEDSFTVRYVFSGSPASNAGIKSGDTIIAENNKPIVDWWSTYIADKKRYLLERGDLGNGAITYALADSASPNRTRIVEVTPRLLNFQDIVRLFGLKFLFAASLGAFIVFVLISPVRESGAFLVTWCFLFALNWEISDIPFWPSFGPPLILGPAGGVFYVREILELMGLQLVVSTLLHIALVFPEPLPVGRWRTPAIAGAYALPLALLCIHLMVSDGTLLNRLLAFHGIRLSLNTSLLIVATAIMVVNYKKYLTLSHKAQMRLIVYSMTLFVIVHLSLWNIPLMLTGRSLVTSYDWVLMPAILIPLSMTLSIVNHELFGIRGILRGRIKLLQALLERERRLVTARDNYLRHMEREIIELKNTVAQYEASEQAEPRESEHSLRDLERKYPPIAAAREERLVGASPQWRGIFEQMIVAARSDRPVVIYGESGTGKTDLARTIHELSERSDRTYREISCAQFEHADPAFALGKLFGIGRDHGLTNAPKEGRIGLLEECDGGTLMLDDCDRLPLNVQDLFLYPLEGKPFEPGIGTGLAKTVSVKFIFATNANLDKLVEQGYFRNDVLMRMSNRIDVPSLRERMEDIPPLVEVFVKRICEELKHQISFVTSRAMNLLARFPYSSGNARELEAELRGSISKALLEDDSVLRAGYLSEKIRKGVTDPAAPTEMLPSRPPSSPSEASAKFGAVSQVESELEALRRHKFHIASAEEELGYSHKSKTLSNHLRGMCVRALSECDWDVSSAAQSLAGSDNVEQIPKLKVRIRHVLKRIEDNVSQGTESKLFNNLPAIYHGALNKAIARVRF